MSTRIIVRGLPADATDARLRAHVEAAGFKPADVTDARVARAARPGI
jgi:hypothetical protein